MITIFYTEEFKKRYKALPSVIKRKAERRLNLFKKNPFHPPLHTHKLNPRHLNVWTFYIDRDYRIIFKFKNAKTTIFVYAGHHKDIYRYMKRTF